MQTRPTSDRLRETLFNILAPRIEGARFLDLCAGSGAVGIEALSRGAAQVTFVDSAGLGAILSLFRKLNAQGGELKLCSVAGPVRLLFQLVRFHRVFDIFNTRDEAIKAYQG